jgi:thiosulfate/3-mercaptopyruvate sulfurtransferase
MDAVVSTAWLAHEIGERQEATGSERSPLRMVDVRYYLDPARRGRDAFRAAHLPGAVFLDMDHDLSAPGGGRGLPTGRHPWPGEAQVARVMSAAGIGPGVRVVAYDDASGSTAARLWYLLRAHGHDDVAVLDGGIARWQAEGRPLSTDEPPLAPAVFTARLRPGFVVFKPQMLREHAVRLVLDARIAPRYRGEMEPIDPRAGHVPGARNAPWTENLTSDAVPVFRSPEQLRARYAALGAGSEEPVVYCGSGVTACHDLLALHLAGLRGTLYAGSWSEPLEHVGDARGVGRRGDVDGGVAAREGRLERTAHDALPLAREAGVAAAHRVPVARDLEQQSAGVEIEPGLRAHLQVAPEADVVESRGRGPRG